MESVVAVARVPGEAIVATATKGNVITRATFDVVVARTTDDEIVAVAAVDNEADVWIRLQGGDDDVVSAEAVRLNELNIGGVDGNIGGITEEKEAPLLEGGDRHDIHAARTVELQGVGVGPTLDSIVPIARGSK